MDTKANIRRLTVVICATLLLAGSSAPGAAPPAQEPQSCLAETLDGKYIVSLGASFSYGFELEPFLAVVGMPFVPDEIFPGAEAAMLRTLAARGIHARTINFSCPGEATDTFVTGGCWWVPAGFPLHDGLHYTGSQLEAVEAFLASHAHDVGLITLDLGPNDSYALITGCQATSADPLGCIRAGGDEVMDIALASWTTAIDRLQHLAPTALVVAVVAHDVARLLDVPGGSEWWTAYKARYVPLLRSRGVLIVDMERQFDTSEARLCQLTGFCNPRPDVHPNAAGYDLVADLQLRAVSSACRGR